MASSCKSQPEVTDRKILDAIERTKRTKYPGVARQYGFKDVILYNLGLGATTKDLPWVYENDAQFEAIASFGVVLGKWVEAPFAMKDLMTDYSPKRHLHGEQYLEILQYPIPTAANILISHSLVDVVDKGSSAIFTQSRLVTDADTGKHLFYAESSTFHRGSGGFGGPAVSTARAPAATATYKRCDRTPDHVATEKTTVDQVALYRLSGDWNPLHIEPQFARQSGFDRPILHGLCTFGIAAKHLQQTYGPFKNIKVRFSNVVLPGQTLRIDMWKTSPNKVVFEVRIAETGKVAISNAGVELLGGGSRL